jgi:hypothetical protein
VQQQYSCPFAAISAILDSGGELNMPLKNTAMKERPGGALSPLLAVAKLRTIGQVRRRVLFASCYYFLLVDAQEKKFKLFPWLGSKKRKFLKI